MRAVHNNGRINFINIVVVMYGNVIEKKKKTIIGTEMYEAIYSFIHIFLLYYVNSVHRIHLSEGIFRYSADICGACISCITFFHVLFFHSAWQSIQLAAWLYEFGRISNQLKLAAIAPDTQT